MRKALPMPERIQTALKIACALLTVLLFYQATRLLRIEDPLNDVALPDLSVLSMETKGSPDGAERDATPQPEIPPGMPPRRGAPRAAPLPPSLQNQVDTIQQSEILGRIPRPQPLMLLGIAGRHVFLQTPSGPAGLAAEGEELGGVKVIRIGTNRVLVEAEGKQQELILFPGLPGESLLSNPKSSHP
jgi:hypothetical protein